MQSSAKLEADPYHRVLLMGPVKLGKTQCAIATSPQPTATLLCEDPSALDGARCALGKPIDFEKITSEEVMLREIKVCRDAAKEGKYKTIIVDPFSNYAAHIARSLKAASATEKAPNGDARHWSPALWDRLDWVTDQLFRIPAHIICVSHYMEQSAELDGQLAKSGEGIFPLIDGQSRTKLAAKFFNVVWMDFMPKKKDVPQSWDEKPYEGRVFVTGPRGGWGIGCRSMDTKIIPADFGLLFAEFEARTKKLNGVGAGAKKPIRK